MKKRACVAVLALFMTACLPFVSDSATCEQAAQRQAEDVETHIERGDVKYDLGNYRDAIAEYDRAVRIQPGFAPAYHKRGLARLGLGRYQNAIDDFDEALRLQSDYDEAVRLLPDDPDIYLSRGIAKAMLGRSQEALADMEHALALAQAAGNADLVTHIEREIRKLEGRIESQAFRVPPS